jgi:hypothetical protein
MFQIIIFGIDEIRRRQEYYPVFVKPKLTRIDRNYN